MVSLMPHSIRQSKSQVQPRFMDLENKTIPLDGGTIEIL